ncbi:MAG TPA: hypothetical protein PK079_02165 [Leptospiraceae bacterium]|nr:hypothetical protein [Leptospiraceae bacterium]HMW03522.1 hypothetical protein [Leptospiraceae bacterium]HMX35467.1 hypothetical protein [Leptospiraceae bacterium]HMY29558.1 hypothetical protein [Leptospiraceae bacterium]HMZ67570.1 hypothetical protein [Leptospiraceae bacterium]
MNQRYFYILVLSFLGLFLSCSKLDTIEYSPKLTPESFLSTQHWMRIQFGNFNFVLSQPSSSLIVYFVSLFDIYIAYRFYQTIQNQKSRLYWAIGLFMTGAGALLAGTSYQAFGYEIKCNGREFCTWTSWWEINYAFLSGLGMNAFLLGASHSNATGSFRKGIQTYAVVNAVLYSILLYFGAFTANWFLVSFEFLSLSSTPSVFFFIWLYGRDYKKEKSQANLYLRNTWIILVAVIVIYAIYLIAGITAPLWKMGIWFTENDILHVGMIYWVYYIGKNLLKEVKDVEANKN